MKTITGRVKTAYMQIGNEEFKYLIVRDDYASQWYVVYPPHEQELRDMGYVDTSTKVAFDVSHAKIAYLIPTEEI